MTPERLLELGFTPAGTCNCSGSLNRKYKRGEFLIYLTKTQFKVKRFGTTVKGYSSIEGLQKYLQSALPTIFS
jgi:hypothetical protein